MTTPLPARPGSKLDSLRAQLAEAESDAAHIIREATVLARRVQACEGAIVAGDDPHSSDEVILQALIAARRLRPLEAAQRGAHEAHRAARDRVAGLRSELTATEAAAWQELRALPELRRGDKAAGHVARVEALMQHLTGYTLAELPEPAQ